MGVPLIDLADQHAAIRPQLIEAFERVLDSGRYILGPEVQAFEQALAAQCGTRFAIGLSSGTDALLAAMMALGIGPGDEVITTPFTFFATASCVARLGARPVFVDIDSNTFNIDASQIEGAITDKTRAILPVHLFGQSADMGTIVDIAGRHGLKVIEDCAQASGATYQGKPVGSLGDVGCLSFYPTKNLPALGDAGACVTDDEELAQRIRALRVHGSETGYVYPMIGGNFRLDAVHAALLAVKLPLLRQWVEARRALAARYDRLLEETAVGVPVASREGEHAYNQYTIRIFGGMRDAVAHHLTAKGIGSRVYYPMPLHLQPCFAHLGYQPESLPASEEAAAEVLSLPIFPEMSRSQQDAVVAAVREVYAGE